MSCVNKASLQFKDCCKRLDLSEQQLEQIVYDYTNQLGNENTFPTDTYIEQQLRGIPTSELSDSQRELYKLKYEEAQPLDTFELAQQRVLDLQQYYPDDRIRIIQRNNGKYQVVVNTDHSQIETEQEIRQIKKEAIANGTFMKVRNPRTGELVNSNLNERQWLQVRTKAFKEWFGDWENPTIFTANNVDDIEALQQKYPSKLPNKFYHHSTNKFGRQVFDNREGNKERLHIIGRLITDKVDVLVVENPNSDNKISHITLATAEGVKPVESNRELKNNQDKIQPLDDYVDTTFTNNLRNDVSKVVDENGEPLVVYHHTDNPDLTEFSINFDNYFAKDGGTKEAIFFDENETGTLNRKYDIPVFLNIKDLHEYNDTKEQLHQRGTTYRQVVNESAAANNIDGGIHMKDFDDNKMEHQSVWVVHNPNQIKSATDNAGAFSTQSNNIKLQRLPNNARREYLLDKLKGYYSQQDYVRDLVQRDLGMFLATHRGFSLNKFGTQEIRNFKKTSNIDNEVKLYTLLLRLAYGIAIYEPYVKKHSNGKVTVITTFRTLDNLIDYFYNNRISMFNDLSLLDLESEYNRLVLEDEIQENSNEFNRFYINPKKKDEIYNNLLKKAIIEADAINASMEYLESLPNSQEDNAFVADCIRFIKNGSIINFEMYGLQVREVWDYLRKRHYDISSIRNTVQLFLTYTNLAIKSIKDDGETLTREKIEQRFDKFTFSGTAVTANGEELEIYDIEDSQEGLQQVCQAIADAAPKKEDGKPIFGSPWCVATFNYDPKTKKATPTNSAGDYWTHYNQGKRQIAFHNGKPVAFNSSSHQENEWWDFFDGIDNSYSGYSDIKNIKISNRLNLFDLEGNEFLHFRSGGIEMRYRGNTLDEIEIKLKNLQKLGIHNVSYNYNKYNHALNYESTDGLRFNYNRECFDYSNKLGLQTSLYFRKAFASDTTVTSLEIISSKLFLGLTYVPPVIGITILDDGFFPYFRYRGKDFNIKVDQNVVDTLKESYNLLLELIKSIDTFDDELTKLIQKGVYTTEKDLYDYLLKTDYLEKLNKIQETLNQAVEQINKDQEAVDWFKSEVEIEKQREENKKKRKEATSSTRRDRQRREALDLALEYAQENEYSNSDEDLTQLRSDYQNEYDEALKDEENSIQDIDLTLGLGVSKSLAEMYNEGIRKPFNKELSKKLRDILSKYHFEFLDDADMSYFGDNVLGATDMLQKIIYLASENDRNAITEPEEFAHSFITMMGAKYRRPENRDKYPETKLYSELRDLVEKTSLYQQVYDTYKDVYTYKNGRPNLTAIKEEALGQALAAILLNREEQYEGDRTFFAKVKRWLQKVIRNIRIQLRRKTKVGEKLISVERALQDELINIADSVLDGSYKKKYLDKLNPKGYNRVDLAQSLQYDIEHNNGRIIDFMHTVNDLGGMVDGSLAYRGQGTVYRKAVDTLHDIDVTVPLNVHGLLDRFPSIASNSFFAPEQRFWDNDSLKNAITQTRFYMELQRRTAQPIHFIAAFTSGEDVITNLMICDDDVLVERFKNLTGNYNDRLAKFTEEERQKMYLVDLFFINRNENRIYQDAESNITFSEYTVPFEAKLKMSRAKDLFDYQNFNPAFRHYYGKRDVRMQKLSENQESKFYTFKDGTRINTPFPLNSQLMDALEAMNDFANNDAVTMTLSGYAGTGKTSLMEIFAKKMRMENKAVAFCASTNKAAAVLKSKVSKSGFKATTVNKLFGINIEVDSGQSYDANNVITVLKDNDINEGTIIVIDEASMVNEENYRILNEVAERRQLKIIYVGDKAQLAPVNEDKVSIVFRNSDGKVVELTKVERTADNAILKEATNLRNGQDMSGVSSFNNNGEGVAYVSESLEKAREKRGEKKISDEVIEHFIGGLSENPDYFRILAYTNARVAYYNDTVRKLLGYNDNTPRVGEPIIGYNNWGYNWKTKQYRFVNSESYKVTLVSAPRKTSLRIGDETFELEVTPIQLENSLKETDQIELVDIKGNSDNKETAIKLAKLKSEYWDKARKATGLLKRLYLQTVNEIERFLFVNTDITDPSKKGKDGKPVVLQKKVFDFGYALTVHKSQGSTFTHVLMDDMDISQAQGSNTSLLEVVDFGDESSESTSSTTLELTSDLVQQLRYVAMSRATNTVTVLSDNVKQEDSPLNHINENQQSQQLILPESETNINIYAGTGENADLSNFAYRPVMEKSPLTGDYVTYNTVEGAFQAAKLGYTNLSAEEIAKIETKLMSATGAEARKIGRSIQGLNTEDWDKNSSAIMKEIIYDSFVQNPETIQKLLATGNATLTHTQDKGKWGTEFPRLLMEVREELRGQQSELSTQQPLLQTQPVTFTESTGEYHQRTVENITWSDVTLALVNDDTTLGERLTEREANKQGKYIYDFLPDTLDINDIKRKVRNQIITMESDQAYGHKGKVLPTKNIKLNITGNGIYTLLPKGITQELLNDYVTEYLKELIANGVTISEIRSGGQTGVDEAGIIAAQRLGIPASVHAPKGFLFRNAEGKDISDRNAFKNRFNNPTQSVQQVQQQNTSQEEYTPNNPAYREEPDLSDVAFSELDAEQKRKDWIELYSDVYGFTPELVVITVEKGDGETTDDVWHINVLKSEQPTLEEQQSLEEQPQEPSYEERQLAISEQVSNLISNDRGLKATELRQLSELMVYWMSEFISDCQDNPEKIFQILGITDYSNSDILKVTLMSRKQIVQMIGVENMFNLCKSYVLTPDVDGTGKGNANINSRALRRQAELLKNNFLGLMQFSTSVWSTLEDFSIGLTESGYNTLETSNPDAFLDEELIKERDKQADGESTLESWLVESNTIDALTTATLLVKRELLHCYLYENTGEVDDQGKPIKRIKTNKFGINERLNPREAINAIIKWVLGCWDLNSMVAALKEHQDKNPWVEQLVAKLSNITGSESDFQSQFFSCMCRSFQLYGVVNENDRRELYQHEINKNPMLLTAFNGIKDLYKIGEHPLLKLDGIDRKMFKEFYEDVEQLIDFSKKKYSEIENIDELNTLISHIYMLLGYYDATPEVVEAAMSDMTFKSLVQNLLTLRTYLDNEKLNKLYNPFDFKANNSIISTLQNVLKPITYIMDDYAVTQFFESGNMRQSNVIPSFMTKLFSKMQLPLAEFEKFVEKEYGQFDWFYDKKLKKYKNEWLSRLVRMPEEERKKLFEHKVQLSFNKKQYMRGMTDSEYAVSVISEYFTAGKQTAWYKVPIMSNKPTSEFIKFIKYDDSDYKDRIVSGMLHIFVLELGRIQTIIKRQNAGIDKSDPRFIKNFDKNGAKFCFLDFLNPFLNESKNTELGQLLNIKINGTRELSTEENARLNDLVKQEIRNSMEARVQQIMESWRQQGILTAVSLIQGFERKPEKAEDNWESAANNAKIENFIWNDTFAAMEILLLTVTDVAQYKDAEDLQKRLAQIHAPGVRGNIQARDYFGNQVSDGTHRAVYLTDFDDFISNVIDNVTKVFDKKIAEAPENEKAQWIALKESLVGEDGAYRQINVADALAYACPTSYRKKAYMFGKWSREKERMYQQLMSGQYDFSTLKQAFGEPLKPFLYSYEEVDAGVENSPIETFKIGVQNKDSEYLLIMADALTRNEDTGIPNILRAIYDVMEESHKVKTDENGRYIAATDGIDDIQFESTVKAGLYGRINLKQFSTDPQGETNAKNELRSKIFDGLGGYNSTYIHETRYEDYCIQQEVPEHFKDHSQAHGSQIRYIIPSDLPLTDANGKIVVYSYFDPATGTERKLDAKQFKVEYENHCATNIQLSLDLLKEEFGLVTPDGQISFDRKQMNQTLSEILKREILSSPRYGIDMLLACSLNADGEFNIPLGDPIQSRRIEQLINSIIKNRINKQKIAGGPVVQVTTFGTSRDLNIRFKSNKGGLLMTRKEFEKSKEEGTYEEYIEKYQDGIAYYEIYAPMYTNELFQQFADRDGNIDIKRIEKENPELLKIIGYRIPTEDKYSCFPARIVGFLPREAGDAVMLPADITAITGSDFDVDKMYLMRKEFKEEKKSKEEITKELEDIVLKGLTGKAKEVIQKQIEGFMNLREGEKESAIKNNINNPIVKAYANMSKKRFVEYTEGRQYHNNMIIDMSYSVLTNKEIAYQVLNPGGFDLLKRMGYAIAAYKDPEVRSKYSFEQLMEMPIEGDGTTLKSLCYRNKNLAFFDTQVQFYKQNSAAGMILGMFAVLKIAHAVLESDGFGIDLGKVFIDKNTNEQIPFGFCGMDFLGMVEVDRRFDLNNQLIGKTLGSLVASAADAVKDPVLNLNNINNQTANVLTTMLRLGIVYEDAALLLSQPAISKALLEHSKRMVNKEFISLNALIKSRMQELDDKYRISESEKIQSEPLNRADLIRGFSEDNTVEAEKLEWKVLNAYLKFDQMSQIIKGLTNATRYNSVSNAVGPLIIDNLIMEYKAGKFSDAITYNGTEAKSISSVFNIHPILDKFSLATVIARRLLGEMPAYSSDFRILVNNSGDYTLSKIMGDRKLFSKLSDFYQSYLLVLSGFINPKEREYYIDKFPVEFMKAKETYSDNPFVLAIRLSTGTFGGKTKGILTLDSVGMEQMQKDKLSSGWADLYKENPELAKKLFVYNFFKGGLGFSPKTFMNLVPISMKESLENNGIRYVDVYRHLPSLGNYSMVFDLFVGNNVGDFKLVPQRNPYSEHQNIQGNRIIITTKFENYELDYFKVKGFNNVYKIFKLQQVDPITKRKVFVEIPVLGNQGEFFDVSVTPINKSNVTNTNTLEEEGFEPSDEEIMSEEGYDPYYTKIAIDIIKNEKGLKDTKEAYETLKSSRKTLEGLSEQEAEQRKSKIREAVMNSLKRRNITFNEEELNKTTNEFC